jgi:hypothetical protein
MLSYPRRPFHLPTSPPSPLLPVLYKEQNLLLTEQNMCRRSGMTFPQPNRKLMVKKSFAAIRHVLGERKRGVFFDDAGNLINLKGGSDGTENKE